MTLSPEPAVRIGGAEAEGPYDLLRVMPVRLGDGRIVVLERGSAELRYFDREGRHLLTAGRRGSGPGEMQGPTRVVGLTGDSLLVYDIELRRVTVFAPDGATASTASHASREHTFAARLSGGSLLLYAYRRFSASPLGIRRDTVRLLRARADSGLDTVIAYPGSEHLYRVSDGVEVGAEVPFGRSTAIAFAGDRVFVGDNAEYRVRIYALDGRLIRIVEGPHRPVPVTDADIARERERRGPARESFAVSVTEEVFAPPNVPTTLPAFSRLLVDAVGWLWVAAYPTDPDAPRTWTVFDDGGRRRCDVQLPARFRLDEVGRDYVLGVARDEDGVEQVQLLSLERP